MVVPDRINQIPEASLKRSINLGLIPSIDFSLNIDDLSAQ
jgi:hypothetical protein